MWSLILLLAAVCLGQQCNVDSVDFDCSRFEEAEVDLTLAGLKQDDPILVDALKTYYLQGPSHLALKLQRPFTMTNLQVRGPSPDGHQH